VSFRKLRLEFSGAFVSNEDIMTVLPLIDGDRVTLRDVDWDLYTRLRSSPDRRNVRMTYVDGVLEVMSPSRIHERLTQLISKLLETWAEERGIEIDCGGSTTMQSEELARGLEPDNSYYVQHAEAMRDRDELDLAIDPPPDLAIEVDITSSSVGRLPVYADLGVQEVWRCDGRSLKFLRLSAAGSYEEIPESAALPGLRPEHVLQFLDQRFDCGQTTLVRRFRDWMRRL
jgi:Uma2 family endonuclease